jgi:DNA mismatch repair protein MutL
MGLYGHFLFFREEEALFIAHLKKIYTRIWYDHLIVKQEKPLSQTLLLPVSLSFSSSECSLIEERAEIIQALGIEMRKMGKNHFIVEALPSFISSEKISDYLLEIIFLKKNFQELHKECLVQAILMTAAHKTFTETEGMALLLQARKECSPPFLCPKGGWLWKSWRKDEIENWFR